MKKLTKDDKKMKTTTTSTHNQGADIKKSAKDDAQCCAKVSKIVVGCHD